MHWPGSTALDTPLSQALRVQQSTAFLGPQGLCPDKGNLPPSKCQQLWPRCWLMQQHALLGWHWLVKHWGSTGRCAGMP